METQGSASLMVGYMISGASKLWLAESGAFTLLLLARLAQLDGLKSNHNCQG